MRSVLRDQIVMRPLAFAVFFLAGLMLSVLPWRSSVAAPTWVRQIAQNMDSSSAMRILYPWIQWLQWESSEVEVSFAIALGDLDNDGDLDLLSQTSVRQINYISTRTDLCSGLQAGNLAKPTKRGVAWGDIDNDGDLDRMQAGNWQVPIGCT
ncbi:MAG: hypothetical protein R2873_04535 [Caldilineaceae bacterium]